MKKITILMLFTSLFISGCTNNEELYKSLKLELETTQTLTDNYFAEYYDLNELNELRSKVDEALDESKEDQYNELLKKLQEENSKLNSFIQKEQKKIFNMPSGDDIYPFSVDVNGLPVGWSGQLLSKQTSSHPLSVDVEESQYKNEPESIYLWIDSSSMEYQQSIQNVETTAITVENDKGEKEKALVNTQIIFTQKDQHSVNIDDDTLLNQRPGYLMKDKKGKLVLALPNYDYEDYYVLYAED